MKNIINKIKAFFADEDGAETVEYVVVVAILVFIAVTIYQGSLMTALQGAIDRLAIVIGANPVT